MTWEKAWREGRTPWDAGGSPPILEALVRSGELPRGRALVPGAGSGYDVLTLATAGREVVGLELSSVAIARFESLRGEAGIVADRARVLARDFFEWEPEERFDLVWDYTFLCAIEPSLRPRWAERMDSLLTAEGELVTLIFPVHQGDPEAGPPYPMSPGLVKDLLEPRFTATKLEPVETSHPARLGKEWLGRWRRR